jgi:1-acyl-sn-glycerol-3-phosphate acyltransferase
MKIVFYTLRSFLFYVGYAISVILVGGSAPVLGLFLPREWVMRHICLPWCRWAVWWAQITCGIRYRVVGIENVPEGGCVLLSKHQSAWETLYFQVLFAPAATVLKQELLSIPFFGWGLRYFDPIAINRGDPTRALKAVIREGEEKLRQGRHVVIFPEGTRTLPGATTTYSVGGAMLATRSGAPAIPVALNSGDCWPRGTLIKRPGLITVTIGEPIDSTQFSTKALNEKARLWIEQAVAEIRQPPA